MGSQYTAVMENVSTNKYRAPCFSSTGEGCRKRSRHCWLFVIHFPGSREDSFPVPATLFSFESVAARLVKTRTVSTTLAEADVAAIDQSPRARRHPRPKACMKSCEMPRRCFDSSVLEETACIWFQTIHQTAPRCGEALELQGRSCLKIITGRVTWLGRKADRPAPNQRGRILSDATSR